MFKGNAGRRFSLLLLDEGEDYLQDWVVDCQWPLETVDGNWKSESTLPGTLRVCTKSLFFEPDDFRIPLVRFPCRMIEDIEQKGTKSFQIRTSGLTKMRANNAVQPYIHERGKYSVWIFSLLYAAFAQFNALFTRQMVMKDDEDQLQKQVRDRACRATFDTSRLVNFSESIQHECAVTHILPLIREPGKLVVTNERLYYQPLTNVSGSNGGLTHPLQGIMSIARRRSALRDCGLEVFFSFEGEENARHMWNRSCAFFEFSGREEREEVLQKLMVDPPNHEIKRFMLDSIEDIVKFATLRWQLGKLSNFDYIFCLNLASGRTLSDLRQWPVFPWILKDYRRRDLDLEDPSFYRDLSKPIGALNPERLAKFKERFQQMSPHGFPPPFLYGTHYSTPGYVLYWLVRVSPSHVLRLQSGKFDAPDRMFHSIAAAWESVMSSPADVKELIPEFFVQDTAFLINKHRLAFGKKQNGKSVDDVELPGWAESPADFLAKNRAALESTYVSNHLHQWIDLIFGYKQNGEASVQADNVFYYLSYEGAVDIESVTDPMERKGLEAQINEFGQTPKQLFKEPHPRREIIPPTPDPNTFRAAEVLGRSSQGRQDIESVRTAGCTHIDKTALSFCLMALAHSSETSEIGDSDAAGSSLGPDRIPDALSENPGRKEEGSRATGRSLSTKLKPTGSLIYEEVTGQYGFNPKDRDRSQNSRMRWRDAAGKILKEKQKTDGFRQATSPRTRIIPASQRDVSLSTASQKLWYPALFRGMQLRHNIDFPNEAVRSAAVSLSSGGTLYCAGSGGSLRVFSLENGDQLRSAKMEQEKGRAMPLTALDLLPHRTSSIQPLALVGSHDKRVYAYSSELGKLIGCFKAHEGAVSVVRLMTRRGERSGRLITASDDGSVKIWTTSEGRAPWDTLLSTGITPENRLEGLGSAVVAVNDGRDGNVLISGTREGVVSAWDLQSPSQTLWKREQSGTSVGGLSLMPDGEHVLCGFDDGLVKLWSMKKPEDTIKSVICPTGVHSCLTDGYIALLGQENGQILVWNVGQALGTPTDAHDRLMSNSEGFFPPLVCAQCAVLNGLCVKAEEKADGGDVLWIAACQEDGNISVFQSR